MIITFEVEDSIAYALAIGSGWVPQIEDTEQELIGDNYPLVANPITAQMFVTGVVSSFLKDHVLREGRKRVVAEFDSIHASVNYKVTSGTFDALILAGNIAGIKAAILSGLSN